MPGMDYPKKEYAAKDYLKKRLRGKKGEMSCGITVSVLTGCLAVYESLRYLSGGELLDLLAAFLCSLGMIGGASMAEDAYKEYKNIKDLIGDLKPKQKQGKLEDLATE